MAIRWALSGYDITLRGVEQVQGPNYISTTAEVTVAKDGRQIGTLHPEKRVYPVAGMAHHRGWHWITDSSATSTSPWAIRSRGGGWAMRSYVKPLANWIWGGAILMALGGALSLSDRRYRVAAGAAKQTRVQGVPAE